MIPKTITYTYRDSRSGIEYRCRFEGVCSVADEPYPPGGQLRVIRNANGQAVAGPLVSEITSWQEVPCDTTYARN